MKCSKDAGELRVKCRKEAGKEQEKCKRNGEADFMAEDYIWTENMTVGYGKTPLIRQIGIHVRAGEIVTLIGPNGAGKSTILRSVIRQLGLLEGTVYLDGMPMKGMGEREIAKRMSILMTERIHPELMNCEDVVGTGRYPYTGRMGILTAEDRGKVREAMELVHAWDLASRDFSQISDGQKQRILLARAICQDPSVIVLDEPTSFLDIRHKLELLAILKKMVLEKQMTVIMSLHELDLAQKISDQVICVHGDHIEKYGAPEEIFTSDYIRKLYGITRGSYNAEFGCVEMEPPAGKPEVFVIGGNGSGISVYRKLQRQGIPFVTGVLHTNDADYQVADMLRRSGKPIVLAVNKVDNYEKFVLDTYEFYNLGLGTPFPVSANSKIGFGDLLDEVLVHCNPQDADEKEDERPRVAIIGKPNAGKSSLINKLLGEDRLIVSDIAGTTRDAIDTTVKRNGKEYVFIDTAGLRKKARVKEDIERYSVIRTVAAVERCDVAILVIDAEEGITEQDAKIAGIAHERGKGMIIAVNKWDLIEKNDKTIYKFTNQVREVLSYMSYAELVFISAKTGQRLPKIFDVLDMVIENHALRVQTGVLNEILTEAVAMKQPPSDKGKRLKLYYITQVSVKPPTFVVFINDRQLMHFSYTRYLENQIRNTFGFRGTPIHIIARERKER